MAVAPEHMRQCQQVLSIPRKRQPKAMVGWLGLDAVRAILEAPDSSTYQVLRPLTRCPPSSLDREHRCLTLVLLPRNARLAGSYHFVGVFPGCSKRAGLVGPAVRDLRGHLDGLYDEGIVS